jgi:hypothetical protein
MMMNGTPGPITVEDLPDSFKLALSDFALQLLVEVYNDSLSLNDDPVLSLEIAWEVVKSRLLPTDSGFMVCSSEFEEPKLYSFELEPVEEMIIKNSADSEELELDAVLATTEPRKTDGKYFTIEELNELAEQINQDGSSLPDVNHDMLNMLVQKHGPNYQALVNEIKHKKGMFRNIRATVHDGKLWIKAYLDKKYSEYVRRFRGLSIEALGKTDMFGRIRKPKYLGFTFTNNPQLPGAGLAA